MYGQTSMFALGCVPVVAVNTFTIKMSSAIKLDCTANVIVTRW
jgi:hypothetical protein